MTKDEGLAKALTNLGEAFQVLQRALVELAGREFDEICIGRSTMQGDAKYFAYFGSAGFTGEIDLWEDEVGWADDIPSAVSQAFVEATGKDLWGLLVERGEVE